MVATTMDQARTRPAAVTAHHDWRTRYFNWFCISTLLVFAAIWVIPLLWALDTSLKPEGEITAHPGAWWSSSFNVTAYRSVINAGDLPHWYLNSAVTSILSALFTVIVASMAGFAFSRVTFRGRQFTLWLILFGLMVPIQVLIVPLFREFNGLHLLNTYWALILVSIPTPIAVFIFKQFFDGIPKELVDSSRVDGASWFRIYRQIFVPLSRPAVSAVAIFTFVWSWNSFLWPLLVLSSTKVMTIPVGLATVQSSYGIRYAQIMASAVLGALPLLVVFLLFQRRIVEGIAGTGLK